MGASRPEVSKEIIMECGCSYMFSPDRFVRGERRFECIHGKLWQISVYVPPIEYKVADVTPATDDE